MALKGLGACCAAAVETLPEAPLPEPFPFPTRKAGERMLVHARAGRQVWHTASYARAGHRGQRRGHSTSMLSQALAGSHS